MSGSVFGFLLLTFVGKGDFNDNDDMLHARLWVRGHGVGVDFLIHGGFKINI